MLANNDGIKEKRGSITYVGDCVLAVCVPVTQKSHALCKRSPENRDFIPIKYAVWERYFDGLIRLFNIVAPGIKSLGGVIGEDVTFDKFISFFDEFSVIILFAHWKDERVEFFDGLVPIDDIVSQIPESFSGVLDLCVCHSAPLAFKIRNQKPNCLIKTISKNEEAKGKYWFYFYLEVFKVLKDGTYTYLEAFNKAFENATKKSNK